MLDKKIKDQDASIELLEDRLKTMTDLFFVSLGLSGFFLVLSTILIRFSLFYAFGFLAYGILSLFACLVVWTGFLQYKMYLFMIHKKLVKAEKERK